MTPFVLPPMAAMAVMAFVSDCFVMMSRGRMFFSSRLRTAWPTRRHSSRFPASMAGIDEVSGKLRPIASSVMPQVLKEAAMPQPPGPGQAVRMICSLSSQLIVPCASFAAAS